MLISSMKIDGRKDIQSVKLASSIRIQSLKPTSYPLSWTILKEVHRTHTISYSTMAKSRKKFFEAWQYPL